MTIGAKASQFITNAIRNASDKAAKTMKVPPLTTAQRKQMKKEMAEAAERGYKKARFRKFGYKKGKFV